MYTVFSLLLLVAYSAAQDNTSTIVCGDASTTPLTALSECTLNVKKDGNSMNAMFDYFKIVGGSGDATVTGVNPPAGTAASNFKFLVTVGKQTGPFSVSSTTLPTVVYPYYVYDAPDGTSTMTCDGLEQQHYLMVGAVANCTVTPRQKGAVIYSKNTAFNPAPADYFDFSTVQPATIANKFSFTATAKKTSIVTAIASGLSPNWNTTIIDIPDDTTQLQCSGAQVQIGNQLTCTLTPQNGGNVIYTNADNFNLSTINEDTKIPKISGYKNAFQPLVWTVGSQSGIYHVSDGYNTQEIDVWDIPDGTTKLDCSDGLPLSPKTNRPQMGVGGVFNCNLAPSKGSATNRVFALPDKFVINCQDKDGTPMDGTYYPVSTTDPTQGGVSPNKVSDAFTFSFTSNTVYHDENYLAVNTAVNDNPLEVEFVPLGNPDKTSTFVCTNSTVDANTEVSCTLTYLTAKEPAFVASNTIKLSDDDDGGKFSKLDAPVHYEFTFTYTAGSRNRQKLVLSDGRGNTVDLEIVGGSDGLSTGATVAVVAGSVIVLCAVLYCCCCRKKSSTETDPLLG